ncbi:MAG: O-antigen ligase family protein [Desulfitobacterium hafniense]|nr:O-antigen ligase family protein [Desulfitobacterium hafniense]
MVWLIPVLTLAILIVAWRNPRLFVPLLILTLPLELSRYWFPHIEALDRFGDFVGGLSLGRIFTFGLIGYFLFEQLRKRGRWFEVGDRSKFSWQSPLFLILLAYILFGAISIIWSVDIPKTIGGTVRLGVLWLLGMAVYYLLSKDRDFWLLPSSLSIVSIILALAGLFEIATGNYFFMGDVYEPIGRINASFIDSNIYARFLILGIIATLVWMVISRDRLSTALGLGVFFVQTAALVFTGSRAGWFTFAFVLLLFVILIPRKSIVFALLGGLVLAGIGIAFNPEQLTRLKEVTEGLRYLSGQRQFLVSAGWDMFLNNPILGVGLGGFQKMMLTEYKDLVQYGVSLSHTSIITTASELGIIGLLILAAALVFILAQIPQALQLRRFSTEGSELNNSYFLTIFAVLGILTIFISAQGEGRFFEDPFLWILLGYLAYLRDLREVG